MSAIYEFEVTGDPKGQPRPKAFARKMGNKYTARVYDPGTAEGWKSAIAIAVKEAEIQGLMLEGPVSLTMVAIFARPKSHFGSGKNSAIIKPSAPFWHTGKPDLDNIIKAAKDALTQLGVWRDDSQVCKSHTEKPYATGKGHARSIFRIETLSNQLDQ